MALPIEVLTSAEAVFRREHGRIIASLIRLCGSFDRAEEAMQEAFAAALRYWTERGVPDNPGAWITTAAHRNRNDDPQGERQTAHPRRPIRRDEGTARWILYPRLRESRRGNRLGREDPDRLQRRRGLYRDPPNRRDSSALGAVRRTDAATG